MRLLNLALMSRWQNWFTILAMVAIASVAINSVSKAYNKGE